MASSLWGLKRTCYWLHPIKTRECDNPLQPPQGNATAEAEAYEWEIPINSKHTVKTWSYTEILSLEIKLWGKLREHLILTNQHFFSTIVWVEVFLASFTFPLNPLCLLPVLGCAEGIPETACEGSLGRLLPRACKASWPGCLNLMLIPF